jgi:phage gp46-like protein
MDVRLFYNPNREEIGFIDLAMAGADLAQGRTLESAVLISLFTDARANVDDRLPTDVTTRRGWWADSFTPQDLTGSRLWLLSREKQTTETLTRAREICQESLAWFVRDGICDRVTVETSYPRQGMLGIAVELFRPNGQREDYRFDVHWDELVARIESDDFTPTPAVTVLTTEEGEALSTEDGFLIALEG